MPYASSSCRSARSTALPGARTSPLRFVTFLAPKLFGFYERIAEYAGRRLECPVEITAGASYDELTAADVAFVCGLPYVSLAHHAEPIAAPVLVGERYRGRPVYFSDVIVRRESAFQSFADLRGRSWSYNEPLSQSGYGITRYFLAQRGETNGYFGQVVEAGWHEQAVRLVSSGKVDASAIDSHVLALMMRDEPELAQQLRIIGSLGPSTIQPVVAARRLSPVFKSQLRRIFLSLADDPEGKEYLAQAMVDRFTPVGDGDYDDIREMLRTAEAANFLTLR